MEKLLVVFGLMVYLNIGYGIANCVRGEEDWDFSLIVLVVLWPIMVALVIWVAMVVAMVNGVVNIIMILLWFVFGGAYKLITNHKKAWNELVEIWNHQVFS